MQNAISVALKWATVFVLSLGMFTPNRLGRKHGIGSEQKPLSALPR
jgi:hypothetical protein